jgi:hypothetical protein
VIRGKSFRGKPGAQYVSNTVARDAQLKQKAMQDADLANAAAMRQKAMQDADLANAAAMRQKAMQDADAAKSMMSMGPQIPAAPSVARTPTMSPQGMNREFVGPQRPGFKKGGSVGSASKRADGCAQRGKTKGRMI